MVASNMKTIINAMIITIILAAIIRHPFDARILHFTTETGKLMLKSISRANNRDKDSPLHQNQLSLFYQVTL